VDTFQFEKDGADVPGPGGDFDFGGGFDCLTVTRTVDATSYATDALGEEGHLVVGEGGVA
jgi:hypothetical protein